MNKGGTWTRGCVIRCRTRRTAADIGYTRGPDLCTGVQQAFISAQQNITSAARTWQGTIFHAARREMIPPSQQGRPTVILKASQDRESPPDLWQQIQLRLATAPYLSSPGTFRQANRRARPLLAAGGRRQPMVNNHPSGVPLPTKQVADGQQAGRILVRAQVVGRPGILKGLRKPAVTKAPQASPADGLRGLHHAQQQPQVTLAAAAGIRAWLLRGTDRAAEASGGGLVSRRCIHQASWR
jgi:hypothetical protein